MLRQAIEKVKKEMYDKAQAQLHEEDRVYTRSACGLRKKGYVCTKEAGHEGAHIAHGSLGTVIHSWV